MTRLQVDWNAGDLPAYDSFVFVVSEVADLTIKGDNDRIMLFVLLQDAYFDVLLDGKPAQIRVETVGRHAMVRGYLVVKVRILKTLH